MAKTAAKSQVPPSYPGVTPYLVVRGADEAIRFYKAAFGAKERYRLVMGDKVGHAELDIGGSTIMLSDEFPQHGASPLTLNGSSVSFAIFVADADKAFAKAVKAGAKVERAVEDQFYGYRSGRLVDPFGHRWSIEQHLEEVSPKEMQKRLDAMMAGNAPAADAEQAKPAKRKKG